MRFRWLLFGTVREAADMHRQVRKVLNAQCDILSEEALGGITSAHAALREAIESGATEDDLRNRMSDMEMAASKYFKPYPSPGWRENIEVMLVAIAVAMAIRTFFLQPFKIPTGSMQPTLYGITVDDLRNVSGARIPGVLTRIGHAFALGTFYNHLVAEHDGRMTGIGPPEKFAVFFHRQNVTMNYHVDGRWETRTHRLWFTPDDLRQRTGLRGGEVFRRGQDIIKLKRVSGDHLFVDRLSYNFRRPRRGEIIVFQTEGIRGLEQDLFYIKRLVGLGGERIRIGADRHVRIDQVRLDASTPRFEHVYHFEGEPRDSVYSGHLPGWLLPNETAELPIRPNHYFVLGDNTVNSSDSRHWGDFSRENVIGKSAFVYWPISKRFGWGQR